MIFKEEIRWFLYFILVAFVLLTLQSFGWAEGNVGFNYSRAVNDASWGVTGDWEHDAGIFDLTVEGDLQAGDLYKGITDVAISFDVAAVAIKFDSRNTFKGYSLGGMGRKNVLGTSLVLPMGDVEFSFGIFGQNGNPFAPQNALTALTAAGFTEEDFEGLGLENITLSEGISVKDGSALLGGLETAFDFDIAGRDFKLAIQTLLEIAGEGERVHQIRSNLGTHGEFLGAFDWQAALTLEAQLYGKVVEYETTWFVGLGYAFQ